MAVIGLGDRWLIGPSVFAKHHATLLLITTISSLLQVFVNLNTPLKSSHQSGTYGLLYE